MRRRFTVRQREYARLFVKSRLEYFNSFYGFSINRVAIKNTSSRWGSCSSKNNLNFNYKIIYLKPNFADYLIVHELCHLGELNHSERFWRLVGKTIPNYDRINKELKRISVKKI